MSGSLVTVVGCMGSGKTEKLIEIYHYSLERETDAVVFKPSIDTRNNSSNVESRNGRAVQAVTVRDILSIADYIYETDDPPQVILIDEVQFFDAFDLVEVLLDLTMLGIDVYCFGLELNSDGNVFGGMGELLAHSDEVIKLKAKCSECGGAAGYTAFVGDVKLNEIEVGDLDVYKPMCRSCYYGAGDWDQGDYEDDLENDYHYLTVGGEDLGFKMDIALRQATLDEIGYTLEDIQSIDTLDGANNLLIDLGFIEVDEHMSDYLEVDEDE